MPIGRTGVQFDRLLRIIDRHIMMARGGTGKAEGGQGLRIDRIEGIRGQRQPVAFADGLDWVAPSKQGFKHLDDRCPGQWSGELGVALRCCEKQLAGLLKGVASELPEIPGAAMKQLPCIRVLLPPVLDFAPLGAAPFSFLALRDCCVT